LPRRPVIWQTPLRRVALAISAGYLHTCTRKFRFATTITKYSDSTLQDNRVTPQAVATVDGRKV
jgi:hypothetical protein